MGAATHANHNKSADNQDTFGAYTDGYSKNFVAVLDGHGDKGHKISQFACDALQRNLFTNSDLRKDPSLAFAKAYKDTQAQIIHEHGEDANFSGTTAVAAYLNKDRLAVANVGDSRAVIGRCGTAASRCSQASLCAIDMSSDQKPDRRDEKHRIEQQGGKVGQSLFPVENHFGGVSFVRAGPARVMGPDGMSGLAMSRSLGDAYLHPHVIAKPEIHERRLDSRDKLLILGSDGIWDMMGSQEAVNIARRHKDPNAAAAEIADISRNRWMKETNNMMTDDITAVVMRLDHADRSSTGQRSDRPSRRSSDNKLDHRGGSSSGQRVDNTIVLNNKSSDRKVGRSTGQLLDHTISTNRSSDRASGYQTTGSRGVSQPQSGGHRSSEMATGSRGSDQGHRRSDSHGHGRRHNSSHPQIRQDPAGVPAFPVPKCRFYS